MTDSTGEEQAGFVIHKEGRVYAYWDSCPHTGVSLAWVPGRYLDVDEAFLQCSTHGALFTLDTGLCVQGPCAGQSLAPVSVVIEKGSVFVKKSVESAS